MVKMCKKKQVLEELSKCLGLRSTACKNCGISRTTFYNWFNDDPVFKQGVIDIDEVMKDHVEAELYKLIKSGHPAAIIYYCKTKMRDRGYGENVENIISGDAPPQNITFKFEHISPEDRLKAVKEWVNTDDPVDTDKIAQDTIDRISAAQQPVKNEVVTIGFEEPSTEVTIGQVRKGDSNPDPSLSKDSTFSTTNNNPIKTECEPCNQEGTYQCEYCGKVHKNSEICFRRIRNDPVVRPAAYDW